MREILLILLLHKQAHDKTGISESLHAYINRARLILHVGWAYFQEKYHNSRKYTHPPSLGSHLSSLPMGIFSRDCSNYTLNRHKLHLLLLVK